MVTDLVGSVLVAGTVVFTVGAVRWRLEYERPLAESLPLINADRGRRAWIQTWMLVAMFVTTAGIAGFAVMPDTQRATQLAVMAASAYALGALCMIVSLAFGLTVVPWAAERTVAVGSIPEGFAAYRAWSSGLYVIHMVASYAAFAMLGAAVLASDAVPHWSGWVGLGLGVGCLAGFVATRFAGPFNPPILAHTYTGLLGVVLLFT
jgi:hypothetical protein